MKDQISEVRSLLHRNFIIVVKDDVKNMWSRLTLDYEKRYFLDLIKRKQWQESAVLKSLDEKPHYLTTTIITPSFEVGSHYLGGHDLPLLETIFLFGFDEKEKHLEINGKWKNVNLDSMTDMDILSVNCNGHVDYLHLSSPKIKEIEWHGNNPEKTFSNGVRLNFRG